MDVFPQVALFPHLEYLRILFWCPWEARDLTPHRYWTHLGICDSIVRGRSLCGHLLRTNSERFGRDWEMEVLRIRGNMNSRLYVVSLSIVARFRKP